MNGENEFRPRLGRMRAAGRRRGRKYLDDVLAAVSRAGGAPQGGRKAFSGSRIGRGAALGLLLGSRSHARGLRGRRAIVKARLVRLAGRGQAAARAHLRYIQRDGTTREGAPGALYSSCEDVADGRAFLERCEGDRHQFRFIVSAEDGADYDDLKPLIRRVMRRMGADLGTGLDWVAVDHRDTAHPHTHVLVRGKDDRGDNLVIAHNYIARGLRERVAELVTLDLGPRTQLEVRDRLRREVAAERLTSIDRWLLRDADQTGTVRAGGRDMFDVAIRAGRLKKLGALGLAEPLESGRWRLADGVEAALRAIGERGDIIRTMQRELTARGLECAVAETALHGGGALAAPLVGRVVARGLSDESHDRHYLLVDGTDGRMHYVAIGAGDRTEVLPEGAVVRVTPGTAKVRQVDRIVAEIAAEAGGIYTEEAHLARDEGASPEFVRAHVRRLETIRRGVGVPERRADGGWAVGSDHLERAAAYEAKRIGRSPVRIDLLSPVPVDLLPGAEGVTWLDRELLSDSPEPLRETGFGAVVRRAKAARLSWLLQQGLAETGEEGARFSREMLAVLRRRELLDLSRGLADEFGLPVRTGERGERLAGVLRRRMDLASGRYGLVHGDGEMVLVQWRPELQQQIGRVLTGRIGPRGWSWRRSRSRGIEIG